MQTVIRTADTGAGTLYNRRGGIGNRHQPGRGGAEEKASSPARKRNGFLTGRLLPVTADYHVDSPEKGTSINLTTREGFEYLYRSAANYAALLGVNLPFPRKKRSSHPRLDIVRLYGVMENLLPEHVNLE